MGPALPFAIAAGFFPAHLRLALVASPRPRQGPEIMALELAWGDKGNLQPEFYSMGAAYPGAAPRCPACHCFRYIGPEMTDCLEDYGKPLMYNQF